VHCKLEIAAAIKWVLSHPKEAAKMTQRACALLEQDQGSVERTSDYVKKTILQKTPRATFLL
jgi:ABC-type nitrate/sulfonate/bicarbonate transport system substrate-binding protein